VYQLVRLQAADQVSRAAPAAARRSATEVGATPPKEGLVARQYLRYQGRVRATPRGDIVPERLCNGYNGVGAGDRLRRAPMILLQLFTQRCRLLQGDGSKIVERAAAKRGTSRSSARESRVCGNQSTAAEAFAPQVPDTITDW
jgi:hypothetical protein